MFFKTSVRVDLQNFGLTIPQLIGTVIGIGLLLGLHLTIESKNAITTTPTDGIFSIGISITTSILMDQAGFPSFNESRDVSRNVTTSAPDVFFTTEENWNNMKLFFNIPLTSQEYTHTEIGILSGALFLVLLSFIGTTLFAFKSRAVTYPLEREVFFLPSYRYLN